MRIEIHIELDEDQHTAEQIAEIAREAKFAAEGAVGLTKSNQRPRRDFDYEVHVEYTPLPDPELEEELDQLAAMSRLGCDKYGSI